MAVNERLNSLGERHRNLEATIAEEMRRPSYDDLRVLDLKRQKLAIKDEISSLLTAPPKKAK